MQQVWVKFITGTGNYGQEVVGESNYQDNLIKAAGGANLNNEAIQVQALIALDDQNEFDKNAVMVAINGGTVGYLPRQSALNFREKLLREGHSNAMYSCSAILKGGYEKGGGEMASYGVWLDLPIRSKAPFEISQERMALAPVGGGGRKSKTNTQSQRVNRPSVPSKSRSSLGRILVWLTAAAICFYVYRFFSNDKAPQGEIPTKQDNAVPQVAQIPKPFAEQGNAQDIQPKPDNRPKPEAKPETINPADVDSAKEQELAKAKQMEEEKKGVEAKATSEKIDVIQSQITEMNQAADQFKKAVEAGVEPFKNERYFSRIKVRNLSKKIDDQIKALGNSKQAMDASAKFQPELTNMKKLLEQFKE